MASVCLCSSSAWRQQLQQIKWRNILIFKYIIPRNNLSSKARQGRMRILNRFMLMYVKWRRRHGRYTRGKFYVQQRSEACAGFVVLLYTEDYMSNMLAPSTIEYSQKVYTNFVVFIYYNSLDLDVLNWLLLLINIKCVYTLGVCHASSCL